jgi:DNA-binding response OmpR family regulator
MRRVLVLEDDEDIASALARGLSREGYEPVVAHDFAEAEAALAASEVDAAVIDVMLGEDDGRTMVRRLRSRGLRAPIVMLSALSGVEDRAAGLESGADDYVAKPFDFADLVARLKVQERRREGAANRRFGDLTYDRDRREVTGPARAVTLTAREALLLELFLDNAEFVLSRGAIFDALWSAVGGHSENVVDVYIGYLRRKLAMTASTAELRTLRGRGFMLTDPREEARRP